MDGVSEIKVGLTLLRKTERTIRVPGQILRARQRDCRPLVWQEFRRIPGEIFCVPWFCCLADEVVSESPGYRARSPATATVHVSVRAVPVRTFAQSAQQTF